MPRDKKILDIKGRTGLKRVDKLEEKITGHINRARQAIQRTVDTEMVKAYWLSGRDIVEEEQNGQERAKYGSFLIKELSERLKRLYGRGFSTTTLKEMRTFYFEYQDITLISPKGHAPRDLSSADFCPVLGWSHYRALMRVKRSNDWISFMHRKT